MTQERGNHDGNNASDHVCDHHSLAVRASVKDEAENEEDAAGSALDEMIVGSYSDVGGRTSKSRESDALNTKGRVDHDGEEDGGGGREGEDVSVEGDEEEREGEGKGAGDGDGDDAEDRGEGE